MSRSHLLTPLYLQSRFRRLFNRFTRRQGPHLRFKTREGSSLRWERPEDMLIAIVILEDALRR